MPKRDTHDEWCDLNAEEPYMSWMEEYADRVGYRDAEDEEWLGPQ